MRHVVHRAWRSSDEGFSLVEVIIAMFVFSVAVLGLASVTMTSVLSLRHTRDREQATNAASAAIEDVRARDFEDIFLDPGDSDVAALGGCYEGEPIVEDAPSAVAGIDAVPFQRTMGNGGVVTVTVYITSAQEDDATPDSCSTKELDPFADPDPAPSEVVELDVKRVVAIAQWDDRDGSRQVEQETLITSTGRGLPVPDFEMGPSGATMTMTSEEVSSGGEVCARHQLRNLGSQDTYDWEMLESDGSGGGNLKTPDTTSYRTPNDKFIVEAYMQYPATDQTSTPPAPSGTTVLFTDYDGNIRPESTLEIPSGESANVWFCFDVQDTSLSVGSTITTSVAVHSRYDSNRVEKVQHQIRIIDGERWFYLYDPDDDQAHNRGVGSSPTVYPTMEFGEEDGIENSPSNLGTIDYSNRDLSDWDQDVDVDKQPGIRLVRSNDEVRQVSWHHNFLDDTVLHRSAMIRLWVSTPTALAGGIIGTDPATHSDQAFQVSLAHLNQQERLPGTDIYSAGVSYTQSVNGWVLVELAVDFGADVSFAANEYLRLQITCAASSDEDCVVAYDNTAYPAGLQVDVG